MLSHRLQQAKCLDVNKKKCVVHKDFFSQFTSNIIDVRNSAKAELLQVTSVPKRRIPSPVVIHCTTGFGILFFGTDIILINLRTPSNIMPPLPELMSQKSEGSHNYKI